MAERPPFGYNKRDKPLPHKFGYKFTLNLLTDTVRSTVATYMRTSKATNDPSTIEVNPRNSAFAVDTGALICEDSIVQKMSIVKNYFMTENARETENFTAIKFFNSMIMGVFEDSWTPKDEKTSLEVEDVLELTRDATNMDVTPKYNGTNLTGLASTQLVPLSTVTKTEVFGDVNLTVDAMMEGVDFDLDTYFNKRFFTNGGKISAASPRMNNTILRESNGGVFTSSETKFLPKRMRFGRRDLFMGELFHLPKHLDFAQVIDHSQVPANAGTVGFKIIVSFNEWNTEFDQKR